MWRDGWRHRQAMHRQLLGSMHWWLLGIFEKENETIIFKEQIKKYTANPKKKKEKSGHNSYRELQRNSLLSK